MSAHAGWIGATMPLVLGVLIITSGLPIWVLLIGVSTVYAALGLAIGAVDIGILAALPSRLVGLLEHDLLQAIPMYVFVGLAVARLPWGQAVFACTRRAADRLLGRHLGSEAVATFMLGALIAPMNGSAASSGLVLSRLAGPRFSQAARPHRLPWLSAACAFGVVVPPSVVLILLGDAMMRAHTEASQMPGYLAGAQRIINTQDLFRAALLPAVAILLMWMLIAWWQGRRTPKPLTGDSEPAPGGRAWLTAILCVGVVGAAVGAVITGLMFAVEAAATLAVLVLIGAVATRSMDGPTWRAVLMESMHTTGALLALLVGATTFSLVLRLLGGDRWIAQTCAALDWPAWAVAASILALFALCAWALDAFEMIFIVVPIIAPLMVLLVGDAQQAGVLLLLMLQLGLLLPPMGYAVMVVQSQLGASIARRALLRAMAPFIAVQIIAIAVVASWAPGVHLLDPPGSREVPPAKLTTDDAERQMREMGTPSSDEEDGNEKANDPTDKRASAPGGRH